PRAVVPCCGRADQGNGVAPVVGPRDAERYRGGIGAPAAAFEVGNERPVPGCDTSEHTLLGQAGELRAWRSIDVRGIARPHDAVASRGGEFAQLVVLAAGHEYHQTSELPKVHVTHCRRLP